MSYELGRGLSVGGGTHAFTLSLTHNLHKEMAEASQLYHGFMQYAVCDKLTLTLICSEEHNVCP